MRHCKKNFTIVIEAIFVFLVFCGADWQPSPGHTQIPLWPGTPPNAAAAPGPEIYRKSPNFPGEIPAHELTEVSSPMLTVFSPEGKNSGAAILVFPGGAYRNLMIDLEGTEICEWMNARGITCVLVKYRVPGSGPFRSQGKKGANKAEWRALQDAQRALNIVRHRAAEWKIDPTKIGVIGFSAGGHLAISLSTEKKLAYSPIDEVDKVHLPPNFCLALYPGYLANKKNPTKLAPEIHISKSTPPTFLVHTQDDSINPVEYSLLYFSALKKAQIPAELHIFSQGGHGYGLRLTPLPVSGWPKLAERWLKTIGAVEE